MFDGKYATETWYNFSTHLISVSAIPYKTGNTEIKLN